MKKKGFTLLEILIVLAVIAILIGIALPRIKGMQDEANITKAKAEMKALQAAVTSYYINHHNIYPDALATMESATPLIIASIPNDPVTAAAYGYATDGANYYILWANTPNPSGTQPDITAIDSTGALTGGVNDGYCISNKSGLGCI